MRVALVSDLNWGGAAIATMRLAEALARSSVEIVWLSGFVKQPTSSVPVRSVIPNDPIYRARRRFTPEEAWNRRLPSFAAERLERALRRAAPDVVNVHNLHMAGAEGWSPELLRACCAVAPSVWTLHDMWSFTGGCNHSFGCNTFVDGCGERCLSCPGHEDARAEDLDAGWRVRRALLSDEPGLVAVSPSRWLADNARAGLWRDHRIEIIPNPVPLGVYAIDDRTGARRSLGIDVDGPVLLAVSHYFKDWLKGMDLLADALARLGSNVTLLLLGGGEIETFAANVKVHRFGNVSDDRTKALVYNAADLLVHPSRAENLPIVVTEALACGTPAVSFAVGGLPELVRQGSTGWICDELSAASLATTVRGALNELTAGTDLRDSCRALAHELCSERAAVSRYVELFESLVA